MIFSKVFFLGRNRPPPVLHQRKENSMSEAIIKLTNDRIKVKGGEYVQDLVRCENCRKSHIDGKTTHYLWCTEWGRSTDTFGYCERGEIEGE